MLLRQDTTRPDCSSHPTTGEYDEYLDEDPDVVERPEAISLTNVEGRIAFEHVTFAYEEGKPVLHEPCHNATV